MKTQRPDSAPVINVRGLSCLLSGKMVLSEISFAISKGSFTAIIGANGAGKSTLLKCTGGLTECSGEISLCGHDLRSMSARQRARCVAWLHQGVLSDIPYTVRQFAMLSRFPRRPVLSGETAEDLTVVDAALKKTGADKYAGRYLSTLSGGERQRALLAAALAQETEILFLDEPASFLDYSSQAEMLALVETTGSEGKTILMVTHDINMALGSAEHLIALKNGHIIWQGSTNAFPASELLPRLFSTEFTALQDPSQSRPYFIPKGLIR